MSPTNKHERSDKHQPSANSARSGNAPGAAEAESRSREEARDDAEASRDDRPATSVPAQRERWENEGGQPGGVISSTDTSRPRKPGDKRGA
ncbi:MAG: hypothetical protein WCZ28_03275 [Burkholderiaceae bacterium]